MNSEALADPATAAKGRVLPFGKYLLLSRVSVGGMAEVFKAIPEGARRIEEIVAIKRILPNIAEDNEFIGMFIDEARIAGHLNHPNICRIFELGQVGDDLYIAMQFLWGRDLLKVMNRFKRVGQPMPPAMAAFVAAKACAALHYAHTKRDATGNPLNIIHRDVSPQNIIVGYSGQVKLIDFGVARAASQSQKTQAGILKGKFGYMSPEMIRGLAVDHRSDVFAMGICLHEALTGSRLFYGETDFATLEQVRDARVQPPSRKAPGVPRELDDIVLQALARDTEDRCPSAEYLQRRLENFLATTYPGFGEADVGQVMRQAFGNEVAREKERLSVFADMLQRGRLKRGAAIPPLPSDSSSESLQSSGEQVAGDESTVGAPVHHNALFTPSEAQREADGDGDGETAHEEKTRIFFSASEMDNREIPSEPRLPMHLSEPPRPSSPISDVVMRDGARSSIAPTRSTLPLSPFDTQPEAPPDSGTYVRASRSQAPLFGEAFEEQTRIPTQPIGTLSGGDTTHHIPRISRSNRPALLALGALALMSAAYLLVHWLVPSKATLEIAAVGAPHALVRVDGVVRGNPPLRVTDLAPGVHTIEIDAKGYKVAQRNVRLAAGEVRPASFVLERNIVLRSSERVSPVVEARPLSPNVEVLPKTEQEKLAERARDRSRERAAQSGSEAAAKLAQPKNGALLKDESANSAGATGESAQAAAAAPGLPATEPGATEPGTTEPGTTEPGTTEPGATDLAAAAAEPTTPAANEAAPDDGLGELLISTLPWSRVFVDDVDTGRDTPVRALRVAPGPHRIGLRTSDGTMHTVEVYVEAGQTVRVIRRF